MPTTIKIVAFQRSRHQLYMSFQLEDLIFSNSYWYDESMNFYALEEIYGKEAMERIYFHIVLFELNKICSLQPTHIDLGIFSPFYTQEFEDIWRVIFKNVWAQWRYENDRPDYYGPTFLNPIVENEYTAIPLKEGEISILALSSGGKDSLVCQKLLDRAQLRYDTLSYSSSIYGTSAKQHALSKAVIGASDAVHQRKMWIFDDFLDAPVLQMHPELTVETLTAAETPSSVFATLPYALKHGYKYIALGHERSADTGQVFWEKTGESVNHQWGKSYEAEDLINTYIRTHLLDNFHYFSLLKPIHDVVIFNLLRQDADLVPLTNSCNISKPWCEKCPKCAYVGLGFMAYLPKEIVQQTFKTNLLDQPDNLYYYRQMLGLEDQLPFECLGQTNEVKLAFALCLQLGYEGKAMDLFKEEVLPQLDLAPILDYYLKIYDDHKIPPPIFQKIESIVDQAVQDGENYIAQLIRKPENK